MLYNILDDMAGSGPRTGTANLPLHCGKNSYPYPVNRKTYDSSMQFLAQAVGRAKIGDKDKLEAFKRLRAWT